jgi:tetratricopeptide (TPR) repeat protein
MNRLTLDEARAALPELDELRPVVDHLLVSSEPDRSRTWSGSGRLGTVGSRLIPAHALDQETIANVASAEAAHLARLYDHVARAMAGLAAGDHAAAATELLDAAGLEEGRDRPARAAAYASAAYRVARDLRDQGPAALALRRWGRARWALGELGDALDLYAVSHDRERALEKPRAAAEAAIGAGNVLEEQGRWVEAAAWYRKALDSLDALDDPAPERWQALLNLHIVTRSRGKVEESAPMLDDAARAVAAAGAREAEPFIRNARGQLCMARGDFVGAEGHLRDALGAASNARARVTIRLNLTEALLAQGRVLDASEHAREAEREAVRAGLVPKLPEVYRMLGRIASAERDPDAFVLFERALEIVRDRGLPRLEEALTLQAYAMAEAERGERAAARELLTDAGRLFSEVGIARMRDAWADVYAGPNVLEAPLPKEMGDDVV